jgi:hypothetical protein
MVPQHPDKHRSEHTILLAVDQQRGRMYSDGHEAAA